MIAPLRIGLIGAGAIAQSYVEVFRGLEHARVTAVADPRLDAAATVAEALRCPSYASHEDLADHGLCDLAVVCTPPSTHLEIAIDFLERGIPVLCEKPFAIDQEAALKMVAAAENAGVPVTMAAKFRYVDDVVRARSIVESGILGEIVLFENVFASRVGMAGRWNSDPVISGGGVLIDNGTHSVDIARYFLGAIAEVMAVEGKRVQDVVVEDTAQLFVRSADQVLGTVDLSWSVDKEVDSYIDVYGSHGTIRVGWRGARYRQVSSPDWVSFGGGYDKIDAMRRQVENFCGAIRGDEQLLISAADAVASVEVIEAAYRSLREKRWETVGSADRPGW